MAFLNFQGDNVAVFSLRRDKLVMNRPTVMFMQRYRIFFFRGHGRWSFIHSNPKIVFFFFRGAGKKKIQLVFFYF